MKTQRFELVELLKVNTFVSVNALLKFTDQPQLNNQNGKRVQILAIEVYDVNTVPVSPSGNPVADIAAIKNASLTLNFGGVDGIKQVPLGRLNMIHVNTTADPFTDTQFEFENLSQVAWTKSGITFNSAPAGSNIAYLFGVHYRLID